MFKTFLITGGCGFIGKSLIKNLLIKDNDLRIIVLDNLSVGKIDSLSTFARFNVINKIESVNESGIYLYEGDILNEKLCVELSKDIDCIVHLAANTGVHPSVLNPRMDMENNVVGTFNMLEAARMNNIKKFIFASSGAPAGEIEPPIHEEIAPHPVSPYGSSKLAGEGYCSSFSKTFGVNTTVLRFGNVYGPGSLHKSSVVAKFINNVLNNSICEIYGDGLQTRDFIYIDDLVDAILNACDLDVGGEIFQIASGQELTILELANTLKEAFSELGYTMKIKHGDERLGDVKRNYSDTSKALNMLNWSSKTDIKNGLIQTIKDLIDSSPTTN